jgi:tetratricopeptide (TPR) repeat protein
MSINNFVDKKVVDVLSEHRKQIESALEAYKGKKYDTAIDELQSIVEKHPRSDIAYQILGRSYHKIGQHQQAYEALKKSAEINAKNIGECWTEIGEMLAETGQVKSAIAAYEYVIKYAPSHAAAWRELGNVYFGLNQTEKAIKYLKKALKLKKDDPRSHFLLGLIHENDKEWKTASKFFEKAVKYGLNDQYFADFNFFYGYTIAKIGKVKKGIPYLEKAIELDPGYLRAWKTLEYYCKKLGQKEKADACTVTIEALSQK